MIELLLAVVVCLAIGAAVGVYLTLALVRRREADADRDPARGPGPVVGSTSPTSRMQWPYVSVAPECPGCLTSRVRGATFCHRCGRPTSRSPIVAAPRSVAAPGPVRAGVTVLPQGVDLPEGEAPARLGNVGERELDAAS